MQANRQRIGALALGLVCAWWAGVAAGGPFDALFGTREAEPEGMGWARPLAGGPIGTLLVCPRWTMSDRQMLRTAVDVRLDTIPTWTRTDLGCAEGFADEWPDATPGAVEAALAAALGGNYALYIVANVQLDTLPETFLAGLIERVEAGAGLLLVNHRGPAPESIQTLLEALEPVEDPGITHGLGEAFVPEWRHGFFFVEAAAHGAGRVVQLDYPGPLPQTHCLLPALDAPEAISQAQRAGFVSLVARAACWAADRLPALQISSVTLSGPRGPEEEETMPGLPEAFVEGQQGLVRAMPLRTFALALSAPAPQDLGVRIRLREPDRNREIIYSGLPAVAAGSQAYTFTVDVGTGAYFVDIWLLDPRGAVAAWHTEAVAIDAWPDFDELVIWKETVEPHDAIPISLVVNPLLSENVPAQMHAANACTVYARAIDAFGRIVGEAAAPSGSQGGPVRLNLGVADLFAPTVRVEVYAVPHEGTTFDDAVLRRAAYGYAVLPVDQRDRLPEFGLYAHGTLHHEFNAIAQAETLAQAGLETLCTPGDLLDAEFLGMAGLAMMPELAAIVPGAIEPGEVRVPSFSDGPYLDEETTRIQERLINLGGVRPAVYSLGHGNCIAEHGENLCQSPASLAGFRRVLQNAYGDLAALNRAWGTDYPAWNAVEPLSAEEAAASGHFAPFVAFRRYMDAAFAAVQGECARAVYEYASDGRAGFSTGHAPDLYRGYDWPTLATLDFLALPADPVSVGQLRSFRPAFAPGALVLGAGPATWGEAYARWLPWHAALNGIPGVMVDAAQGTAESAAPRAALDATGAPSPVFQALAASVRDVRSELIPLLRQAVRAPAAVAVYTSRASAYVNHVDPAFGQGTSAAERTWVRLLGDLGIPFDFVSPHTVRQGALEAYEALVLPAARALNDDEIDAIHAFAEGGGHLLADLIPGMFDAYGAPRPQAPLLAVFGAAADGPAQPTEPGPATIALGEGAEAVGGTFDAIVVDASLRCTEALPGGLAGEVPVWAVHQRDGAQSLLLNHALPPYPDLAPESAQRLRALMRHALAAMDIRPAVELVTDEAGYFPGERAAFRFEDAQLTLLLADPGLSGKVRVRVPLPDGLTAYTLRPTEKSLWPERGRVSIEPGGAAIITQLPYEVAEVEVVASGTIPGRRIPVAVNIKTKDQLPGRHLVHVRIEHLDGRPLPYYAHAVDCPDGAGTTYIPLAYNDAEGSYRVVVRDLLSGVTGEATVHVGAQDRAPNAVSGRTSSN